MVVMVAGDGCEQASSTSNIETKERSENEAEPKKTDNTLLIVSSH